MKRGNTYSVRYKYKDHSGKPCEGWESFKTRKEAQERKITVEKELLDGSFLVPDTMTVEEMLYKWIPIQSTKHKWSPKTYTQSVAMVQNLIVPYIGKWKVQELRTYDIEKFYATLAKTPCGQYVHGIKQTLTDKQKKRLLSSTSIHEVHTLLKTAFSYAVEWDLIHKIPLPRDAPKVNIEERTPSGTKKPCWHGHLRPHTGQTPSGADREDRSELLFPRPDPSSTPAPAK